MIKKNKNEFKEQQKTGNKSSGGQYKNLKVSDSVQRTKNYVYQLYPKYSKEQKQQDIRKRPSTAKNVNYMNSPKASTGKQIYSAIDDQCYE